MSSLGEVRFKIQKHSLHTYMHSYIHTYIHIFNTFYQVHMRMKTPAGKEYEVILTTLQAIVLKVRKICVCMYVAAKFGFAFLLHYSLIHFTCILYIHTHIHT